MKQTGIPELSEQVLQATSTIKVKNGTLMLNGEYQADYKQIQVREVPDSYESTWWIRKARLKLKKMKDKHLQQQIEINDELMSYRSMEKPRAEEHNSSQNILGVSRIGTNQLQASTIKRSEFG